jgi:hypothetical protein
MFNKNDIFIYLIIGISLIYIWKTLNISLNYLFPFLIFIGIIYIRENKKIKKEEKNEINIFLESIKQYELYNPLVYKDLLITCDEYLLNGDIINYLKCIEIYDQLNYSLPIGMIKEFYIRKKEFISILQKLLIKPQEKKNRNALFFTS